MLCALLRRVASRVEHGGGGARGGVSVLARGRAAAYRAEERPGALCTKRTSLQVRTVPAAISSSLGRPSRGFKPVSLKHSRRIHRRRKLHARERPRVCELSPHSHSLETPSFTLWHLRTAQHTHHTYFEKSPASTTPATSHRACSVGMRQELVDWMSQQHGSLELVDETLHLALRYLDTFLIRRGTPAPRRPTRHAAAAPPGSRARSNQHKIFSKKKTNAHGAASFFTPHIQGRRLSWRGMAQGRSPSPRSRCPRCLRSR